MSRNPNERIDWFKSHLPDQVGMCLRHTWQATDIPVVGMPDANAGVAYVSGAGELTRKGPPPRGAWCWWTSPTHGHVALSAGEGMIWSTDVHGPRTVGKVHMDYPVNQWGHTYAGWSDWYGVRFDVAGDKKEEDEDMALSKDDVQRIAEAVWAFELTNQTSKPEQVRPARWFLNAILDKVKGSKP